MKSKTLDLAEVLQSVQSLRDEVARLSERLDRLEGGTAPHAPPAPPAAPPTTATTATRTSPPAPELDEELVTVISAAVAAFLGVKPRIRQIRLLGSQSWAQQGRVTIQASHVIPLSHS